LRQTCCAFYKKALFWQFAFWRPEDGTNAQSRHAVGHVIVYKKVCAVIMNKALAMTETNQLVGRRWWWVWVMPPSSNESDWL
jgi:hypothetical protein